MSTSDSTPGTEQELRVGIVGCGGIARSHGRAYAGNPRARIVAAHDVDPAATKKFAEEFDTAAADSLADLAAHGVQLASVCTPPGSHTATTVALLELGISVLLEKPPAVTLAELDVIAEAEAASTGSVYVVFQHRHGSGAKRAHRLLAEGALGAPQIAVCETLWYRPESYFDPAWRGNWAGEGGGPTLGHAIHQIDLMLHLLGNWSTVDAKASRIARPVEFEDVATASVALESGAVASVVTSLLSPREVSRIRVDTTGGTLEVNHLYGYSDADWSWFPLPDAGTLAANGVDPGTARGDSTAAGTGLDVWQASAGTDLPSNHAAQIDELVDDLLAGRRHATTLTSTRPTMEFVTGLYASALEGTTIARGDLTPDSAFYCRLDGGHPADRVSARFTLS
ncbi:Gfo/Idh/MocA family protein [Kineococcus rhizosphaerae]|uniref:Putative dehydrogenase n=1 Tax=Kineococcus rhizosphaerae TaxID=559628 RepID=A0A2T0R3J5_9ACTN|nr:Gfo/Idh/MocA family oxidoreductase [Kineococcus rhizosphaerae]PRY14605.1 putative dehydrogenase [Kineococcus rhizosphaerae]